MKTSNRKISAICMSQVDTSLEVSDKAELASEVFRRIRPQCVALSQITMVPINNSGSKELLDALKALDTSLTDAVRGKTQLPTNLADYIFAPVVELLKKSSITDSELEYTLSILDTLTVHFWSVPGSLPVKLFEQLVPLITFLIGGPPGEPGISLHSDETLANATKCIADLLKSAQRQGTAFLDTIFSDTKSIPALGHTVTVLLECALSENVQVKVNSLRALNLLYQSIDNGEALSMMLPGTVSTLAKLAKGHLHYNAYTELLQLLSTMVTLVFDDFELGTELQHVSSLEDLIGDDHDTSRSTGVHRTAEWIGNTTNELQKALKIILDIDQNSLLHEELREALFHFSTSLLRNCYRTLEPLVPLVLESLSRLSASDSEYTKLFGESFSYGSIATALTAKINHLVETQAANLGWSLGSADTTKSYQSLKQLNFLLQCLQLFNSADSYTSGLVLENIHSSLVKLLKETNSLQSHKKIHSQPESYATQMDLIVSDYSGGKLDETLKPMSLFDGFLDADTEEALVEVLKTVAEFSGAQDVVAEYLTGTGVEGSIGLWMCDIVSNSSKPVVDEFLDFGEAETGNDSYDMINLAVSIADANSIGNTTSYANVKSTVISLRTIRDCCKGDEFKDELIDCLYPVIDSLASTNVTVRNEAQLTTLKLASVMYGGSVQKLIYENRDYLVDSLSMRLTGDAITPRIPVVLVILVRIGGDDILRQFGDLITAIFTLLDLYYGYDSLCEGFFVVFSEIVDQIYRTDFSRFDFDQFVIETQDDNVMFSMPWGMTSKAQAVEFANQEPDVLMDSDDEDEEIKKDKILDIDEDSDDDGASIPTTYEDQHPDVPSDVTKWTSPMSKQTYDLVFDMLGYAERLSQRKSTNMTLASLRLIDKIIPILATQRDRFLPEAVELWSSASSFLFATDDPRIITLSLTVLQSLLKFGSTFFSSKFIDLFKELDKDSELGTLIAKQSVRHLNTSESKCVINRSSTSVNWEEKMFESVCNFYLFALQNLGRFIPLDIATKMVKVTISVDDDESHYGYFDDLVYYTRGM